MTHFNQNAFTDKYITLDGKPLKYRAWEGLVYCDQPVPALIPPPGQRGFPGEYTPLDSVASLTEYSYQSLNVYISVDAWNVARMGKKPPILLKNGIGGYMPCLPEPIIQPPQMASETVLNRYRPNPFDIFPRALSEGYMIVIPGARGSTTKSVDGKTNIGKAPSAIVDLKAAVRWLRANKDLLPGDTECIVSDGTSAGGAFSALLGASGNSPLYTPYLEAIGAADERDDIFAAVCFCPITDLEHADMAYEWLYNRLADKFHFTTVQKTLSGELAAEYPSYINALGLYDENGNPLNADSYNNCILKLLYDSAKHDGVPADFTLDEHLAGIGRWTPVKNPPAFDNLGINTTDDPMHEKGSLENLVFGTGTENACNFTNWSLQKTTGDNTAALSHAMIDRVYLMNCMNFIGEAKSTNAPHWYIRHGAADRDTAFMVSSNLAAKLRQHGREPNYRLAWGRPHCGDYDLDELFGWINQIYTKDTRHD
jgi:acetyl esterase/lipase